MSLKKKSMFVEVRWPFGVIWSSAPLNLSVRIYDKGAQLKIT